MKKATLGLLSVVASGVFAAPALADDMTMTMLGINGQGITYDFNDGVNTFSGDTTAGIFTWQVDSTTSSDYTVGQTFQSFCVELVQQVRTGNQYDYEIVDPTQVPSPNGDIDAGMAAEQAAMISSLFDQHWDDATDGSSLNAAAFQIAVWEIVYEGANVNYGDGQAAATGLSTQNGWFTATNNNGATDLADQWLAGLFNNGISAALMGFTSPTAQDQITIVPLPAPVALAGLGLLGVALGRRRMGALVK